MESTINILIYKENKSLKCANKYKSHAYYEIL